MAVGSPPFTPVGASDDELLARLHAPHSVEEARESLLYWERRAVTLPLRRRRARREAQMMAAAWRERLRHAERERYGPRLREALLELLGVSWRPRPVPVRRIL